MNYMEKFNRALLKAIRYNKLSVNDVNAGAVRMASAKFSFSHNGTVNYFKLVSTRTAPNLENFGYVQSLDLTLFSFNGSYTSAEKLDIPKGIDPSAVKYLHACSVISADDALSVRRTYEESLSEISSCIN